MQARAKHSVRWWEPIFICFCAVFLASASTSAQSIDWEWRHSTLAELTLRQARVTDEERAALTKAIAHQLGFPTYDVKAIGFESEQQMNDAILDTRIELVDLNGDGTLEVIAQGTYKEGCSPTGNCAFWVFQKSGSEYRWLASLNAIQTFQIQRRSSGGFKDIVVEMHGSATLTTLRLLRYRGGRYHGVGCYDANWSILEGETVRTLRDPQLTPCRAK